MKKTSFAICTLALLSGSLLVANQLVADSIEDASTSAIEQVIEHSALEVEQSLISEASEITDAREVAASDDAAKKKKEKEMKEKKEREKKEKEEKEMKEKKERERKKEKEHKEKH